MIENILASRYASPLMIELWSRENLIRLSREFWIAVLRVQMDGEQDLDKKVTMALAINEYTRFVDDINIKSIEERELRLRHDQMAEIEEFNELAGFRLIHEKMTSRDKSDNVEQILHLKSLIHVRDRTVAVLAGLDELARSYATLDMCGRSHNQPAEITTLGKRFANIAEELLLHFNMLENHLQLYPFRGIKGPTGTQQNLVLDERYLFRLMVNDQNPEWVQPIFHCVGQIYPRSLDFQTVGVLVGLAAAMSNFANLIRLMAGTEFVHEGFGENQVGSSAMPHKMNARTCERIRGLYGVLKGHLAMIEHVAGDQWYEGDVSCSVVRRVVFPDCFLAIDGMFEAILTVIEEMEVFPEMIGAELDRYLPFLATTALLSAAINKGMDRQSAHSIIRKHALSAITDIRYGEEYMMSEHENHIFLERLAEDEQFPLSITDINNVVWNISHGRAEQQIARLSARIKEVIDIYPSAALYVPYPIR